MVFTFKIIIAVDGKDCTHEIKLRTLTLYNLKLKLAKYYHKQYTLDLYLGNILLNDNSKIRNLKEGATYRVQFFKPFPSHCLMCDVFLFELTS